MPKRWASTTRRRPAPLHALALQLVSTAPAVAGKASERTKASTGGTTGFARLLTCGVSCTSTVTTSHRRGSEGVECGGAVAWSVSERTKRVMSWLHPNSGQRRNGLSSDEVTAKYRRRIDLLTGSPVAEPLHRHPKTTLLTSSVYASRLADRSENELQEVLPTSGIRHAG